MSKDNSFTKNSRLRTNREFQRVFSNPKKFRKNGLLVLASSNELPYPRIGISISKKRVSKNVDRNRLKRLIRENFRRQKCSLPNVDLVVIVCANNLNELTSYEICTYLEALWLELIKFYKKSF